MPKRAKKRSADVSSRIYRVLHERAINYDLRPGEHVNELALARELAVSRTPIREALNRLSSEGLMTFVPNHGFYSRPIDIEGVRALFELRSGLEAMAVRLACQRASDDGVSELAAYWSGIKERSRNLPMAEIAAHDEAFHERLAGLAENPELLRVLREVNARARFVRLSALENPRYRSITFVEHDKIIAAIRARDCTQAVSLIESHIEITLKDIEQITRDSVARIYLRPAGEAAARANSRPAGGK